MDSANNLKDESLICSRCGKTFLFTIAEQEFYLFKGYIGQKPRRCSPCRSFLAAMSDSGQYGANCWNCSKETWVPFKPRPNQSVLCPDCFRVSIGSIPLAPAKEPIDNVQIAQPAAYNASNTDLEPALDSLLDAGALGEMRRLLNKILDSVEGRLSPEGETPGKRIHRLLDLGLIERRIGSLMLLVIDFRNQAEYRDNYPRGSEAAMVRSIWRFLCDWAKARNADIVQR